jgi:uncharacterized protein YndB with AHSA1/START domain
MDSDSGNAARTESERKSDLELVVARSFAAPVGIVFAAWTQPDLLRLWWVPKSCGITFIACETDARTGGTYKFVFSHPASEAPMTFFGRYIEATPHSRLVWTNEEGVEGAVTTVTFAAQDGQTRVVMNDTYTSAQALEEAVASGSTSGFAESFAQLDDLLRDLGPGFEGV